MSRPALQVVWSGVLEREGKAPGLASPMMRSSAEVAMRNPHKCGDLTIKFPPAKPKVCSKCGKTEQRNRHNGKGEFGPFGTRCKACRMKIGK